MLGKLSLQDSEEKARFITAQPPPDELDMAKYAQYYQSNIKAAAYLSSRSPVFRRLTLLREQGWKNSKGDEYLKTLRDIAENPTPESCRAAFSQMVQDGHELQSATSGLKITRRAFHDSTPRRILEFGSAPGGLLHAALEINPSATATSFTMPRENGSHLFHVDERSLHPRVNVTCADFTLFAGDMLPWAKGPYNIYPMDPSTFFLDRQIPEGTFFDLVICDAGVLSDRDRTEYRRHHVSGQSTRVAITQLALAMKYIQSGGTLIMLLHKPEIWEVMGLALSFESFSDVQLYKPRGTDAIRSSFYLVAKNMHDDSGTQNTIFRWVQQQWEKHTFPCIWEGYHMKDYDQWDGTSMRLAVDIFLEHWGDRLIRLGTPVWEVQANALERAVWMGTRRGTSSRAR
ncbi:unnamed protein product [Zymoseptoria tritici ST99CH_1A5]|uniref:Ribosomal RNA methyltransferase FtsJ domain-containing protein n=1 Tax=Zymoseptoria tritici ST99CH_1A5 TaxID=1276529 RepID=A0A1Y6LER2_ZYMTR|nr:unnamed protein product [Zymoseptoria tritici ST99CH_1A5]